MLWFPGACKRYGYTVVVKCVLALHKKRYINKFKNNAIGKMVTKTQGKVTTNIQFVKKKKKKKNAISKKHKRAKCNKTRYAYTLWLFTEQVCCSLSKR